MSNTSWLKGGIPSVKIVEAGRLLFPVVVQHVETRDVLMVAYADEDALQLTRDTGWAHFFSRSRQTRWQKGERSGNRLQVLSMILDCDQDTWLYEALPEGPVCHRGTTTCFGDGRGSRGDPLRFLERRVKARLQGEPNPGSYTQRLMAEGLPRIAQKVGEEALEVALAAVRYDGQESAGTREALVGEMADLMYHLVVLAERAAISFDDVSRELQVRADKRTSPR